MKRANDTRRLASSLWVWYPNILSRLTSFHQRKEITVTRKTGKRNDLTGTFKFIHRTALAIEENKEMETKKGHKED